MWLKWFPRGARYGVCRLGSLGGLNGTGLILPMSTYVQEFAESTAEEASKQFKAMSLQQKQDAIAKKESKVSGYAVWCLFFLYIDLDMDAGRPRARDGGLWHHERIYRVCEAVGF
jgi:hypothetical protein